MHRTNQADNWVKIHKKTLVNRIIKQSKAKPQNFPIAIIMAGLPGAGKTETSQQLIKLFNMEFVRIDMDELAKYIAGYSPEKADEFRLPASTLVNELFKTSTKQKLDIILDGTFSSKHSLENLQRLIKKNYRTKIIYIVQQPDKAWYFTKQREKEEHRSIKIKGFIESYFGTIDNIKALPKYSHANVSLDLVIKKSNNQNGEWLIDVDPSKIDDYIDIEYNHNKLKKIIKGIKYDS